jgi:hypothetical protein
VSGVLSLPSGHLAFYIELPRVRSKSNYRHSRRSSTWSSIQSFEGEVCIDAKAACPDGWQLGDLAVPIPSRPGVVACVAARTMLDAGNLSKSVLDAVQGVVYHSDASVRGVTEITRRARANQNGVAAFVLLNADAPESEVLEVLAELPAALTQVWSDSPI